MDQNEFLLHVSRDYLQFLDFGREQLVRVDGKKAFAAAGHNGPHFALESPVRNTCHWLLAFCVGHRLDPSRGFAEIAVALYSWLTDECPYFRRGAFVLRQKHGHDWCNGVIGSAWIIEALMRAAEILGIQEARELAETYYGHHRFNSGLGAWHRFDPNGGKYRIDATLDHQAWFSAAAAELGMRTDANRFLDSCEQGTFRIRENGRVHHLFHAGNLYGLALIANYSIRAAISPSSIEEVEAGYHHYTLHPFARMHALMPSHSFWKTERFRGALSFMSVGWIRQLDRNRFGWPYNAPGFELPLLLAHFGDKIPLTWDDMKTIYDEQLVRVMSRDLAFCGRNTQDPLTLSARIYELGLFIESACRK